MKDIQTNEVLRVCTDGTAGSYIMVPEQQLGKISSLLTKHQIKFYADASAISLDDAPAITVINLGSNADPERVQKILDAEP